MIIHIDYSTTINEVRQIFHAAYPYLDIRFADRAHDFAEPAYGARWYEPDQRILKIAAKGRPGFISFYPWDRTGNVERSFQQKFGLYPQIFRKYEDQWLETAGTDELTLQEQNEIAQLSVRETSGLYWIRQETLL